MSILDDLGGEPAGTPTASRPPAEPGPSRTRPGKPEGPGAAGWLGLVLAVLLLLLGVVGIRDGLLGLHAFSGAPWLRTVLRNLDGLHPAWWQPVAAVGAGLLGLLLILAALRPRRRTLVPLRAASDVYLPSRDVAALAQRAVQDCPGVREVTASATAHRISLRVGTDGDAEVEQEVHDRVRQRLGALSPAPRLGIRTHRSGVQA